MGSVPVATGLGGAFLTWHLLTKAPIRPLKELLGMFSKPCRKFEWAGVQSLNDGALGLSRGK